MTTHTPKFVRWAVLLGIVVLLTVFAHIGVSYFVPEPKYDVYFPRTQSCYDVGGACYARGMQAVDSPECVSCMEEERERQELAQKEFEEDRKEYANIAFIAFLVLGVLAMVLGVFLKGSSIASAGLSYGGVLIIVTGGMRHLWQLDQLTQLITVGVALLAVLVVAYRRFKD